MESNDNGVLFGDIEIVRLVHPIGADSIAAVDGLELGYYGPKGQVSLSQHTEQHDRPFLKRQRMGYGSQMGFR